ncbi:N-terminal like protein [Ostertagia ostertagi]
MVHANTTNDLELVLDRIPIEYPALVMETFLSIENGQSELTVASLRCMVTVDGFETQCICVEYNAGLDRRTNGIRHDTECDSGRSTVQLPLPPSGLPYSARSVVVYKNTRGRPPGLLVVSGEGVARHWPSVTSSIHSETVIDLTSEVTLSVQLLESSDIDTSFVLTTTSGSVYLLFGGAVQTRGEIQFAKIGSRETRGIGRRLSNIIFGSQGSASDSSHVINSLVFRGDSQEDGGVSAADAAVVTISPSCMNCFNVDKKGLAWTVNTRTFLEGYVTGFFEVSMTRFDGGAPTDVEWFSVIPVGSSHTNDFKADEESCFVGRVSLCVPGLTSNSTNCERTDGVIILYPQFACDDRFCYVMTVEGGISCVRLLPKAVLVLFRGFDDDLKDDTTFIDDLMDIKENVSQDEMALPLFISAFASFVEKNIVSLLTSSFTPFSENFM